MRSRAFRTIQPVDPLAGFGHRASVSDETRVSPEALGDFVTAVFLSCDLPERRAHGIPLARAVAASLRQVAVERGLEPELPEGL